ncbi:hypothetical protein DFH08DRAFT_935176 [Mycena albidolilacea]|uniref:Uncharacterized protein n=1 Tax=Mycena albidolilacea TaxID=1033008 RepID=A0AAD7ETX5_9AGAR|nr:hypothetical protein DFH08DRAFT_935176 [Mycena albidolilacea]
MAALAIPIGNTTLAERGGTCQARGKRNSKAGLWRGRCQDGGIEGNGKNKHTQRHRGGEKRNLPPSKKQRRKKKSRRIRHRKAQPHPDDEQLQDDKGQPRAPHNHAGDARSEMRAKSPAAYMHRLLRPTFIQRARDNDGRRGVYSGKACLAKGETAEVPLLRPLSAGSDSSEIADICKLYMKKCQNPDGTLVQRVERVKKGWGAVRASTGKRGTAMHGLHHTWKCPLRRTSCTETCKREVPNFRIATIEKTGKENTHPQNNCPLPPQCVALAGARLRAQRRDSRAVVLVMMEEEERERARESGGGAGGRKGDACGTQMRRSAAKAQAPRTRSRRAQRNREKRRRRADDEGQDEEGKHEAGGGGGRTVLARTKRQDHRWKDKKEE